jgi:hypothetical protein
MAGVTGQQGILTPPMDKLFHLNGKIKFHFLDLLVCVSFLFSAVTNSGGSRKLSSFHAIGMSISTT